GVTKLDRLQFDTKEAQQAATLRKMLVAMAKDIRVLLIKLADRLHNMRTIAALPEGKQRRIAQEALEAVSNRLAVLRIKADVSGRPKHYFSIYEKMVVKGKEFDEVQDLVA